MKVLLLLGVLMGGAATAAPPIVVVVSANAEWRALREAKRVERVNRAPYGEWFEESTAGERVVFVQGGWGKISAAASAEYVAARWKPKLLVNLGTCGGFVGKARRGETVVAAKTIVYDIEERMGDAAEAIAHYTTEIDLSWMKREWPGGARKQAMISGDRDLDPRAASMLAGRYGAAVGDWESGAIAWVAARRGVRVLIVRSVSDLVDEAGGEAYAEPGLFERRAREIMERLGRELAEWLRGGPLPATDRAKRE